jgi:nucleoid-associated protein YgaU
MGRYYKFYLLVLSLILSGCVVRTYPLTRDRVDQDVTWGNRGYLEGKAPPAEEKGRETTRTTQVVEIEMRPLIKFEKAKKPVEEMPTEKIEAPAGTEGNRGYITQSITPEIAEPAAAGTFEKYSVVKGDTLQKISKKYYGTTKRWKKIFNANRDVLKTPNSLRPGQALNIPVEGLREPKENLK